MQQSPRAVPERDLGLVAATFTAFDADGAVNLDVIERQAESLVQQQVRGVFVCGTSGEFPSLTTPERMEIAGRWSDVVGNGLELIVHVGHTSLHDARALAAHAEQIGAAGIAAVPPYYFRPRGVEDAVAWASQIAGAAPRIPFFSYHIPSATGVEMPMIAFLLAAAAAIPNLGGLKFTHDDLAEYGRLAAFADGRYEIFFGRDEMLLGAVAMGAYSGVGTTYNVAAPLYRRMYAAYQHGDMTEARRWQLLATTMIDTAVAHGGLPAFKAMSRLAGVDCGPSRMPLPTLDDATVERLQADLEGIGYFLALKEAESGFVPSPAREQIGATPGTGVIAAQG